MIGALSLGEDRLQRSDIKIEADGSEREFDLAEIADTIGTALTDLLLSRQEDDIFNEVNRKFVANIAESVGRGAGRSDRAGQCAQALDLRHASFDRESTD